MVSLRTYLDRSEWFSVKLHSSLIARNCYSMEWQKKIKTSFFESKIIRNFLTHMASAAKSEKVFRFPLVLQSQSNELSWIGSFSFLFAFHVERRYPETAIGNREDGDNRDAFAQRIGATGKAVECSNLHVVARRDSPLIMMSLYLCSSLPRKLKLQNNRYTKRCFWTQKRNFHGQLAGYIKRWWSRLAVHRKWLWLDPLAWNYPKPLRASSRGSKHFE